MPSLPPPARLIPEFNRPHTNSFDPTHLARVVDCAVQGEFFKRIEYAMLGRFSEDEQMPQGFDVENTLSDGSPATWLFPELQMMINPDLMSIASENMKPEDFKLSAKQSKHTCP